MTSIPLLTNEVICDQIDRIIRRATSDSCLVFVHGVHNPNPNPKLIENDIVD